MGRKRKEAPIADATGTTAVDLEAEKEQRSLYDVLQVDRSSTQAEIKKAYHRMALKLHPDKNPGDEEAKEKFQTLQRVFAVLGDPEKRQTYDETGSVEDSELSGEEFKDLYSYYRTLYKKVNVEDIEAAELEYRGSEEETRDLKDLYRRFKGNMNMVFNWLICSQPELDSHRFMVTLNLAIASGELKEYKVYRKWATEAAKRPAPSDPLRRPRLSKQKSREDKDAKNLKALISSRQQDRENNILAALEAKYASKRSSSTKLGGNKGKSALGSYEEPSEEEFQAAQTRVLHGGAVKKPKHRAAKR